MPANCPLLVELNFKLVRGPPPAAAAAPALVPSGHVTVASPSPGGSYVVADAALTSGLSGTVDIPLELVATVADKEYNLGNDFYWKGNEYDVDFTSPSAIWHNSNNTVALYPSCLHAVVEATPHFSVSQDSPSMCPETCALLLPSVSLVHCLVLPRSHSSIIAHMSAASSLPGFGCCFTVSQTQVLLIICFWTSTLSFLTSW